MQKKKKKERKKKFEREDKSNENPFLHHTFVFFLKNFPMNIQNDFKFSIGLNFSQGKCFIGIKFSPG